jgi:protein required for attachment to host cells
MAEAHDTWFLVADGSRARILMTAGRKAPIETVEVFESWEAHLLPHELGRDRPGRSFESSAPTRHGMEPPTDPQLVAKQKFIRRVADTLNRAALEKRFGALYLIAEPRTLGMLRPELHDLTRAAVREEVDKDWISLPEQKLEEHLRELLRPH